jgi:hypothetical protein
MVPYELKPSQNGNISTTDVTDTTDKTWVLFIGVIRVIRGYTLGSGYAALGGEVGQDEGR